MLARIAGELYWMGRYLERAEHTTRLLEHQLTRLVDSPADELALGWSAIYRALRQPPPDVSEDADEAEVFLVADAYTLAGTLVEAKANQDSVLSCWGAARENAKQLRPQLPLKVWTCLNRGFLWLNESNFAEAWANSPAELVAEATERMRLLAGVVDDLMPQDDAWRFLKLGLFVERLGQQTVLLNTWSKYGRRGRAGLALAWSDLLRLCGAYELYCRAHSMAVRRERVLDLLIRNPEASRSLRFCVQRIGDQLAGIDPKGARYPLAAPHRAALRLAATVEIEEPAREGKSRDDSGKSEDDGSKPGNDGGKPGNDSFFATVERDAALLHDLILDTYVNYSVLGGPP